MQVYTGANRYYGIDNLLAGSSCPAAFKSLYPIHVFDVSKQSERLAVGVVDLTVRMEFSANVPVNTQDYALVFTDRMLKFKSGGKECKLYCGFLDMLATLAARAIPLAARALPTILSGLISGGINKVIVVVVLLEMDLHKHDKCYRVQKCKNNCLYLAPHPRFVEGDGLFLKHGNDISNGAGLLMGKTSPLRIIPVLGWLLYLFI